MGHILYCPVLGKKKIIFLSLNRCGACLSCLSLVNYNLDHILNEEDIFWNGTRMFIQSRALDTNGERTRIYIYIIDVSELMCRIT